MPAPKVDLSRARVRALVELGRGSLIVLTDHGCRWQRSRAKARSGTITRSTAQGLLRAGWIEPEDEAMGLYRISAAGGTLAAGISLDDLAEASRPKAGTTPADLVRALERRHPSPPWVLAPEVVIAEPLRLVDLLAVGLFKVVAYEFKLSRSDFLRELELPEKRQPAVDLASAFYFCAPAGLIRPEELPPGAGLVEVFPGDRFLVARESAWKDPDTPHWQLVNSICRSVLKGAKAP